MNIPDLPPDLSFPKLGTAPEDQEFAFEVKRAAIGPFWAGATGPVAADEGRDGHLDAGAMGRGQGTGPLITQ